ncbi:hypothetical protein P792_08305 [Asaia sp. SF2.1]|nr:hypothetical protein P792_08305 [Asaia sp. SF2.1]
MACIHADAADLMLFRRSEICEPCELSRLVQVAERPILPPPIRANLIDIAEGVL